MRGPPAIEPIKLGCGDQAHFWKRFGTPNLGEGVANCRLASRTGDGGSALSFRTAMTKSPHPSDQNKGEKLTLRVI